MATRRAFTFYVASTSSLRALALSVAVAHLVLVGDWRKTVAAARVGADK